MSGKAAALLTAVGIVVSFILLTLVFDTTPPTLRIQNPNTQIAAVAYRDNVIPFQKFGSKLFTVPAIETYYDGAYYVTDRGLGGGRGKFLAALHAATTEYDAVDLFLLAHSNQIVRWLEAFPPEQRQKIRLVYNTGCRDAYQADAWMRLGVRTYVGHPGRASVSPVFYVYFLRRWIRGHSAIDATRVANQKMRPWVLNLGGPASGFRFDGASLADMTVATVDGAMGVTIR